MRYPTAAWMACAWLTAAPALAQTTAPPQPAEGQLVPPPSWAFNDLACAPMVARSTPGKPAPEPTLRVIGTQDTAVRQLMATGDTLVISGGSNAGLEPGQRYFVRRIVREEVATMQGNFLPQSVHTAGWVQILGVDTAVATATVLHACDGIMLDDYLEPFVAPMIVARPTPGSALQHENMGHVLMGNDGARTASTGQLVTIDRGSNAGVSVGQRLLIFRDKRDVRTDTHDRSKIFAQLAANAPLVQIGEVLVTSVREDDATVQIVSAKDAITSGDLVAPIQ